MRGTVLAMGLGLLWTLQAQAQVIYEPVRYQWGTYGEIFYGGAHREFLPMNWPVPGTPENLAQAQRLGFAEPNYRLTVAHLGGQYGTLVYSDLEPFDEAGRHGFTPDDAANEAYQRVPRLQRSALWRPEVIAPPAALTPAQVRAKAIPLLSWARQDSARRNPELQAALLREAAKYDPEMTRRVRRER